MLPEQALQTINMLDVIVVIIMLLCIFTGYKKGLVKSIFDLFSVFIALAIAGKLYPVVGKFLRETGGIYDFLRRTVTNNLGLSNIYPDQTLKAQTDIINQLPIPDFFSKLLLTNNNSELYNFFHVNVVEDYIASFIANLFINSIALVLVFIVTMLVMKALSHSLDIVTKIPVVSSLNRFGGLACGFVSGTLLIWFIFIIITFFFMQPPFPQLLDILSSSKIAVIFYEHNMILDMLGKISI